MNLENIKYGRKYDPYLKKSAWKDESQIDNQIEEMITSKNLNLKKKVVKYLQNCPMRAKLSLTATKQKIVLSKNENGNNVLRFSRDPSHEEDLKKFYYKWRNYSSFANFKTEEWEETLGKLTEDDWDIEALAFQILYHSLAFNRIRSWTFKGAKRKLSDLGFTKSFLKNISPQIFLMDVIGG